MNIEKKAFVVLSTVLGFAIAGLFGFQNDLANVVYGDVTTYGIEMDSTTNKLTESTTPTGGSQTISTNIGNNVTFTYSSVYDDDASWQTLDDTGYFHNSSPINGIRNVKFVSSIDNALLRIYYSKTIEFSKYVEITTTAGELKTFTFNETYPNYFKVVNYSDNPVSFNEFNILYTCSPSDNPINPIPTETTEKFKTTVSVNHELRSQGTHTLYGETYKDFAEEVYQIEYVIDIKFSELSNQEQHYNGNFVVGNNRINETWNNGVGYWDYLDSEQYNGGYWKGTLYLWFDINDLTPSENMLLSLTNNIGWRVDTMTIREVHLYRDEGYSVTSQTFELTEAEGTLYWGGEAGTSAPKTFYLNRLTSSNLISHIDISFYYNAYYYTGGVLFFGNNMGFDLPGSKNTINMHGRMPVNTTTDGAIVRVYLDEYCEFNSDGTMNFSIPWSSAWDIKIRQITFYQLSDEVTPSTPDVEDPTIDETLSTPQTVLEETLGMDKINTAMRNSLVSSGNNYLLKNAISKMQSGEETTVAYIGGSFTEGDQLPNSVHDSWAYHSYQYLTNTYGKGSNVKYQNAGMCGTNTDLAVARFKTDVLDFNPSIVFIEFAVNNSESEIHKETFESMIRMALNHQSNPAVILVMSWTSYSGGSVETYMTNVGNHYQLPIISIHKGLSTYNEIFYYNSSNPEICFALSDNLHPSLNGHKLYAKLVSYCMNTIANEETVDTEITTLPDPLFANRYENMTLYQRGNNAVTVTGFNTNDSTWVSSTGKGNTYQKSGQGGWQLYGGTGTLTMTTSAKAVFILYCSNQYDSSNGTITATVSGGYTAESSRNIRTDEGGVNLGWGQISLIHLLIQDTAQYCTINVSFSGVGQIIGIAVAA